MHDFWALVYFVLCFFFFVDLDGDLGTATFVNRLFVEEHRYNSPLTFMCNFFSQRKSEVSIFSQKSTEKKKNGDGSRRVQWINVSLCRSSTARFLHHQWPSLSQLLRNISFVNILTNSPFLSRLSFLPNTRTAGAHFPGICPLILPQKLESCSVKAGMVFLLAFRCLCLFRHPSMSCTCNVTHSGAVQCYTLSRIMWWTKSYDVTIHWVV